MEALESPLAHPSSFESHSLVCSAAPRAHIPLSPRRAVHVARRVPSLRLEQGVTTVAVRCTNALQLQGTDSEGFESKSTVTALATTVSPRICIKTGSGMREAMRGAAEFKARGGADEDCLAIERGVCLPRCELPRDLDRSQRSTRASPRPTKCTFWEILSIDDSARLFTLAAKLGGQRSRKRARTHFEYTESVV